MTIGRKKGCKKLPFKTKVQENPREVSFRRPPAGFYYLNFRVLAFFTVLFYDCDIWSSAREPRETYSSSEIAQHIQKDSA